MNISQIFPQNIHPTLIKSMAWLVTSIAIGGCSLSTKFDSRIEAYQKQKSQFEHTLPTTDSLRALCEHGEYDAFSSVMQTAESMTEQMKRTNAELTKDIKTAQKEITPPQLSGTFYVWYDSGVPAQTRNAFQFDTKLRDDYYLWARYQDIILDLGKDVMNWHGLSYMRLLVKDLCDKKSN